MESPNQAKHWSANLASYAAGKAGGVLALNWSDSTDTGPLVRRSFALHGFQKTCTETDPTPAAGKAGGFLALDWSDGTDAGPLARRSFQLHGQLAAELQADTGYRRVKTLAITCSAQPGTPLSCGNGIDQSS